MTDFPYAGAKIREWKDSPYRHLVVRPYRIIYRVEEAEVFVIAIVHGRQNLRQYLSDPT